VVRAEARGFFSSRIEIRLLRDTRSVLEYLPTMSVFIRRWEKGGARQISHSFPRMATLPKRTPRNKDREIL